MRLFHVSQDGYSDGHKGAWIMDPSVIASAFQGYWDAGFQIHVHNNGDAGFDVILGELEKAMKRAPLEAALKAITIDAAYSIQLEKRVGSIEVVKGANLTILEANPFEVQPAAIKDIGVWGTMREGRLQPVEKASTHSRFVGHRVATL